MNINIEVLEKMMGDVLKNLKEEISELTVKVQQSRESENWGTYKNLILAYKEIVKLYQDIVEDVYKYDTNNIKQTNSSIKIGFDKETCSLLTSEGFVRKSNKNEDSLIKLFCEEDFLSGYIVTKNNNEMVLKAKTEKLLSNKLEQGVRLNKFIDVSGFRGIGKTYSLINFAKKYDYTVIVPREDSYFRDEYNYDEIYNQNSIQLRGIRNKKCIVDEGVNIDKVKNELGLNIITGYINTTT